MFGVWCPFFMYVVIYAHGHFPCLIKAVLTLYCSANGVSHLLRELQL